MNNNDLFQASRRRFLAQLGGLTVAGMLGPSLLTPRRATAAQAATEAVISKEGILTGSHWGAIRATVKDGRFVAAKPFELDKYPSKMIADCRITYTTRHVFVIRWYAWTGCVSAISAIPPSAVITVLCA